ncbi:hypothetical protein [Gracilibacillus thailandensis]|uniref:hypothetical protein n=1 Tax=Gracilibacillus thailandensis TaxID=563735 RepID=UPI00308405D3
MGTLLQKAESLEWLFKVEDEGDNGFSEFYETVDTVLIGKKTYDRVMKLDLEEFPIYKQRMLCVYKVFY